MGIYIGGFPPSSSAKGVAVLTRLNSISQMALATTEAMDSDDDLLSAKDRRESEVAGGRRVHFDDQSGAASTGLLQSDDEYDVIEMSDSAKAARAKEYDASMDMQDEVSHRDVRTWGVFAREGLMSAGRGQRSKSTSSLRGERGGVWTSHLQSFFVLYRNVLRRIAIFRMKWTRRPTSRPASVLPSTVGCRAFAIRSGTRARSCPATTPVSLSSRVLFGPRIASCGIRPRPSWMTR